MTELQVIIFGIAGLAYWKSKDVILGIIAALLLIFYGLIGIDYDSTELVFGVFTILFGVWTFIRAILIRTGRM